MWDLIRNWWRAGEDGASKVFRQDWRTTVSIGVACTSAIWLLPALRTTAAYVTFIVAIVRNIFERRRAIILTPDSVGVRGPFRAPSFVPRNGIEAVENASVAGSFLLMPRPVKGLRIRLRSGDTFCVPLDMPRRRQIADAIRAAALPPSGAELGGYSSPRKG